MTDNVCIRQESLRGTPAIIALPIKVLLQVFDFMFAVLLKINWCIYSATTQKQCEFRHVRDI